ncbi:MAG: hypothetical protein EKK40_11915 [Bradyrhizobiaceae bacterium]|nr:MAG: hypothetical protein EKK40_11915 [Bradyrhizobiaceae bacterium]
MAKKSKVKDPTEVALSAIQDALNISDEPASDSSFPSRDNVRPPSGSFDDALLGHGAANDDREQIGAMLQTIQRGRPRRGLYALAALFSGLWIAAAGLLTVAFLPSLEAMAGPEAGGGVALIGLACVFIAPLVLFYFLASVAWRTQELSLIAQSMAQMAMRFSEPERVTNDAMVSVGQAIRREISAMGDGVERAIARAGELESLITNEVSALERAYTDNEVRIRALLQDISLQRDSLVGQAEQVRNAISGVQIDLRQDIALISDTIAARVDEIVGNITAMLEERSEHITGAMSVAGDSMILALGERGGDLLDRLEEASAQTAQAVLDASEQLNASLNFKTGHVHEEFADLADRIHEMLNERIDLITGEFEQKSTTIVDGIALRTEEVHDTLKNSGDSLLAEMDLRANDLVAKIDDAGNRLADYLLTSGEKAGEALDVTVNTLVAKVVSQTETSRDALTVQMATFETLMKQQGAELAEKFARDSGTLGALITQHVSEFDRTVKTFGGELVERMGTHTQNVTDSLKNYVDNFDTRVAAHGEQINTSLDQRLTAFESSLETRVTKLDLSLDTTIKAVDAAIDNNIKALDETFQQRGTTLNETIAVRFEGIQKGLENHATLVAGDIEERVSRFENLLGIRVDAAANRVEASGQKASDILVTRAEELTQGIKSRVEDAERALSGLMIDTTETIQNNARSAQHSLLSLSGEVSTQLKTAATEVERALHSGAHEVESALFQASNNASSQIRSASSEIERTITAATDSFGTALTGRVELITGGVEQHTERLSQIIDDKRAPLIEAIAAKGEELAGIINSATQNAVKLIETQGGDFTITMMNNSSDIARQITVASETATGAVNKSLKEMELNSRAAIDQSRQVATAAVTEMQETSKILRTDTVALFERLREGNILLQEVLTGAHENLNSLERALVTRVAEFVSTLNDVTTRNGTSTEVLEEQLRIFNESTSGVLDGLGQMAAQFEGHGQMLVQAAKMIEESNERTGQSVADRNATLESLVNTIDLRTLDLDERLHRFTTVLDESLDAAESRAANIARVVSESAGATSSIVGRQFEAVRLAAEDERRQTIEAMSEIYDEGTREAGQMFQQAADKFTDIVQSMRQMASELHRELDETRAELRRGVLDMPQEAAENTAQMRKVIVDQIEALAELNRIVARHGRGLDVATTSTRAAPRDEELVAVSSAAVRTEAPRPAPRSRDVTTSASSLPPPDLGVPGPAPRRTEAPPVSPAGDAWLSDLLNRAEGDLDRDPRSRAAAPSRPVANPLEALSLDISRLVDRDLAAEMWDRYQRGERKAFTKRLYTPSGQKAFDEVARKYRADRAFKQTVDRYISEFERLLDEISRDDRGPAALRNQLTSEGGLVYTLLAHAVGRLG